MDSQPINLDSSDSDGDDFPPGTQPPPKRSRVVSTSEDNLQSSSYDGGNEESPSKQQPLPINQTVFEEGEEMYPCAYKKYGCGRVFSEPFKFKEHVTKHCKYSVLHACREQPCRGSPTAKFPTLEKLMKHAIDRHRIANIMTPDGVVKFSVSPQFLEPREENGLIVPDVNAKIIGQGALDCDGDKYGIAFFLISSWRNLTDDRVYLVPVTYGERKRIDHFVQVKCALRGVGDNFVRPKSGLANAAFSCAMTNAIGNAYDFFQAISFQDVITYDKFEFTAKARKRDDGRMEFDLIVELQTYRCHVMRQSGLEPKKYASLIKQLKLEPSVEQDLRASVFHANPCSITKVLTPQLFGDADLIIESHDQPGIFLTFSSALMSYAIKKRVLHLKTGPKKAVAVVVFASTSQLMKAEGAWKERGAKLGVLVSTLSTDENAQMICQNLQLNGCEIMLTTLTSLKTALTLESESLRCVLTSKLKFVVLFDADYFCMYDLKQCLAKIEEGVNRNIVRVAVSPSVSKNLAASLYSHGFSYGSNALSVGVKPDVAIEKMDIDIWFVADIPSKLKAIMQIINKHDRHDQRWLILATEHPQDQIGQLLDALSLAFQNRVSSVPTKETMEQNPNGFDHFESNPNGILVTDYFAIHDAHINCFTAVILHTMPKSKADLRRLADLVVAEKELKPCFGISDPYSLEVEDDGDLFA